jgi:diguanylate cyclase (GGDEF)-like protein
MRSGELLFLNDYGRRIWGEKTGTRCWEMLQSGQDGPCSFCSNSRLLDDEGKPAGVYIWEFQNSFNGRWYQCRDQAIRWPDGRLVRMEIATDITDRKQMEDELREARYRAEALANTDVLTGLNNRRAFFELGEQSLKEARRYGHPVTVAMFDLDYFKRINDLYGHAAGDETLRMVAKTVRSLVRESDIVARLGGEEFGLLLPRTGQVQATPLIERLHGAIQALAIPHGTHVIRCTCCFGVVEASSPCNTLDALLAEADHALLRAKRTGRNRIELIDSPTQRVPAPRGLEK